MIFGNRSSRLEPLTKQDKNRRDRLHYQAARLLPRIMGRLGYRCHWCNRAIVLLRHIPKDRILRRTTHTVTVYDPLTKKSQEHHYATADHVVPISNGGLSNWDNIVPACGPCNASRNEMEFVRTEEERARRKICPYCGARKPGGRSRCASCRLDDKTAWIMDMREVFETSTL